MPVLLIFLSGCAADTGLIKTGSKDLVYFNFFIFLKTGDQNMNGSGDAVIVRDKIMKLRVNDNVLDRLLFKFITRSDGINSVILPDRQMVYIKEDGVFSIMMTHYLYMILTAYDFDIKTDPHIKDVEKGENGIKQIIFTYFKQIIKIEIEKRYGDGRPKRIECIINGDSLLFDITSYGSYDFNVDTAGYRELVDNSGKSLFEWLGDFYAER